MSIPLVKSHEPSLRALEHRLKNRQTVKNMLMIASSPLKNKLYTDETIISIPLTNSNEYVYDSFITIENKIIFQ